MPAAVGVAAKAKQADGGGRGGAFQSRQLATYALGCVVLGLRTHSVLRLFADDLKQIYTDESIQTIASLNLTLHAAVIDFLDLDIETVVIDNKNDLAVSDALNLCDGVLTEQTLEPYYQIWSSKFGFQPNQSILDLLFNVGREAVFVLRNA